MYVFSHVFEFSACSLFTLKANNLPSVQKWVMLSMSCGYWDAGAGTEERSEVSQKDQTLTVYITSCGGKAWAAMILIKILGGGDVFKYSGELCRNFLCKV